MIAERKGDKGREKKEEGGMVPHFLDHRS